MLWMSFFKRDKLTGIMIIKITFLLFNKCSWGIPKVSLIIIFNLVTQLLFFFVYSFSFVLSNLKIIFCNICKTEHFWLSPDNLISISNFLLKGGYCEGVRTKI